MSTILSRLPARSWLRLSLVLFVLTGLGSCQAWAQLTTGTIAGTVRDESGGAVPGANVTAKNVDTGIIRNTVTGAQGRYEFANLPSGSYEVTASMAGFQTSIHAGTALSVGQTAIVDHALRVGEVTQFNRYWRSLVSGNDDRDGVAARG